MLVKLDERVMFMITTYLEEAEIESLSKSNREINKLIYDNVLIENRLLKYNSDLYKKVWSEIKNNPKFSYLYITSQKIENQKFFNNKESHLNFMMC